VDISALDQYKQLLLAKRRELLPAIIGTLSDAGGQKNGLEILRIGRVRTLKQSSRPVCARATVIYSEQSNRHWPELPKAPLGCAMCVGVPSLKPRLKAVPWTRLRRNCKEQQG
jgi:hypothetical protein